MRRISFPFLLALGACALAANCKSSDNNTPVDGGAGGGGSASQGSSASGGKSSTGGTTSESRASGGSGGASAGSGGTTIQESSSKVRDGAVPDGPGQGGVMSSGGQTGSAGAPDAGAGTGGMAGADAGFLTGPGGVRAACSPPAGYRNLFVEVLGKTDSEVAAKLDKMVQQLFHGTSEQKIYYEMGTNQAQIYDTGNGDVRSEGQSYAMMMAVQLGMRTEFDKLWNYAASCMRQSNGTFTWSMEQESCKAKQTGFAPDGEEYFAMALLLASRRWDTSTGVDYAVEAKKVLTALATQLMFSKDPACVYYTMNSGNSDASYVLPLFYSEWACFDSENAALWKAALTHARDPFFRNACNKTTGLASERSALDGKPQDDFGPDSWRVPMNIMMDYNLNYADAEWQASYAKTHAAFWIKEGLTSYGDRYGLTGDRKNPGHGPGMDGVNAMLAFALPPGDANAKALVQRAWDVPLQTGSYRYYNGCLQLLSFLHTSGRFRLFY